jgi:hypothetical protein
MKRRYRDKLDWLVPPTAGRRLLYIGNVDDLPENIFKHESLLASLARVAASTFAVFKSTAAVRRLSGRGFDVAAGEIGEVAAGRRFEVVVSADALEHLSDCGRFLEAISRLVPSGGLLLVTSPNPTGFGRILETLFFGRAKANRAHTCWFSGQVLGQLAARHGWEVIEEVRIDDLGRYHGRERDGRKPSIAGRLRAILLVCLNALVCAGLPQFSETLGFALRRTDEVRSNRETAP